MSKNNSFVEQSVTIKSPRHVVFNALTDADQLMRWFPTRVESDPRPGGKFKFVWEFANPKENGSQEGNYVEIVPNEKLSYTWTAGSDPTLVTFVLSEVNGETMVELNHSTAEDGADEKKLHADHANQWGFFLMNLKSYLEAGVDMRKEKLNQMTQVS
ncbi:MAG TPA: SRPBCC domain-containing protein [Anaerolineales bacterium]